MGLSAVDLNNSHLDNEMSFDKGRHWGEQLLPRDFLRTHPLPQVAKIHEVGVDGGETSTRLDLRQPFLLYKSYSSIKVHARSVRKETRGKIREVGPMVVIPADYTGWFSIVTDNGRTAPFFTSIEQVAAAHVPFFLVRTEVAAYKVSDPRLIAGRTTYAKTTIKTGHVLKLLGVYEDVNAKHYKNLNRNHRKCSSATTAKYAQCVNYKGEVLFLSFSAQGKFYSTATRGSRSVNQVYLISHLLRTVKFPVTVRLVCGFLPKIPCNFTGTLRLHSIRHEDIILACTLLKERNVMFEMDVNSSFALSREPIHMRTDAYNGALAFCADEADIWRRQMKVVHHVYPEEGEKAPTSNSRRNSKDNNNRHHQLVGLSASTATNGSSSGSGSGGSGSSGGKPIVQRYKAPTCPPPPPPPQPVLTTNLTKDSLRHETQSVCISMIFDEMDEEDCGSNGPGTTEGDCGKKGPTKFWTLRRLKQLVQNEPQYEAPYAVVNKAKGGGGGGPFNNEVVDDGSENANAEFTAGWNKGRRLKWYQKIPAFDLVFPENGTYILSQKSDDSVIYDSIG